MKQKHKKEQVENPEQIDYREAHKALKDAELRIALRSRGIDPYELSQKDIDEIKRHINKMQQVDAVMKGRMNAIEQEGKKEQAVISQELETIVARVYWEQNPMPPVPEMHITEGQPEPGQQVLQETAGQEVVSGKEPGIEPVDKEAQGMSGDTGAGGELKTEPIKPE